MSMRLLSAAAALLLPLVTVAGKPAPAPTGPTFGVTAPYVKIGDAQGGQNPVFGVGHAITPISGTAFKGFAAAYASADWDGTHSEVQIWLATSRDSGLTWGRTRLVSRGPTYHYNGAAIAAAPNAQGGSRIHVAWGDDSLSNCSGAILYSYADTDASGNVGAFAAPVVVSGSATATTYERAIAVDPAGGLHLVFGAAEGTHYAFSGDAGVTWQAPVVLDPRNDHVDVSANAAGVFIAVRAYPSTLYFRKMAGESAFRTPVEVPIFADTVSVSANAAGAVYIAGLVPGTGYHAVASTTNFGPTAADWRVKQVSTLSSDGMYKSVLVDGLNRANTVWLSYASSKWSIYFSRSTDGGLTWTAPAAALSFSGDEDIRDANLAATSASKAAVMGSRGGAIVVTIEK